MITRDEFGKIDRILCNQCGREGVQVTTHSAIGRVDLCGDCLGRMKVEVKDYSDVNPRDVYCPSCNAKPEKPCVTSALKPTSSHTKRKEHARLVASVRQPATATSGGTGDGGA